MNNILLVMIFIVQLLIFKEHMKDFMEMKTMRCQLTALKKAVSATQQELKTLKLMIANAAATEAARTDAGAIVVFGGVTEGVALVEYMHVNAYSQTPLSLSGRQVLMNPIADSLHDYFMDVNNSLDEYFKPPLWPDLEPIFREVATQSPTVK
jgi:hypothetical protein